MATTSNYALRLLASLKTEAEKVAGRRGHDAEPVHQRRRGGEAGGAAYGALLRGARRAGKAGGLSIVSCGQWVTNRPGLAMRSCR